MEVIHYLKYAVCKFQCGNCGEKNTLRSTDKAGVVYCTECKEYYQYGG